MPGIHVTVLGRTDVGLERDHNEDSFLAADLADGWRAAQADTPHELTVRGKGLVLAVCDGMGGAAAGEVASGLAVEALATELAVGADEGEKDTLALVKKMHAAVLAANQRIWEAACAERSRSGMGTTASAVLVTDKTLVVAQVGDSRAYLYRHGKLTQVTRDQSLAGALIESGTLDQAQARDFIHSNVILQALGVEPEVQPTLCTVPIRRGDVLLLCSDGLSGPVPDEKIAEVLGEHAVGAERSLERACEQLIEAAKAEGAPDNVTALLAEFSGDDVPDGDAAVVPEVIDAEVFAPAEPPTAKATANLRAPTDEEIEAYRDKKRDAEKDAHGPGHGHGPTLSEEESEKRTLVIVSVLGVLAILGGALISMAVGH